MLVTSQLPIQTTAIFYSFLTCTCATIHFEKGSNTHAYGWLVARFGAVSLFIFLILWTLQPQLTLQLSARTLQCLF